MIQKTLQCKYRLISITSDCYHIISLVIDITYLFLICIEFTACDKIKTFFMLNSTEYKFYPAHKCKNMSTIVGILTFIRMINQHLRDLNKKFLYLYEF